MKIKCRELDLNLRPYGFQTKAPEGMAMGDSHIILQYFIKLYNIHQTEKLPRQSHTCNVAITMND